MIKIKTDGQATPVDEATDSVTIPFSDSPDQKSPLDELVREGARRMLQAAIDAEVEAFVTLHQDRRDEQGRRLVIKNGSLPRREILTGAGRFP